MAHLALYREFRPQSFADVVGQQHITRTLMNALVQKRMHHAYLLSGPRGTGKTTVARILAKAVNCLNPQQGEPCNECAACRSIISGETMDVIEIDAASNRGIDEIRDLRDKVKYAPADLKFKVYIIDEVHMLSEPAFNALLKTLEEPPEHVLFVLATTEKQKLPVTILSRCQSFEYHRLSTKEIIARLVEVCARYEMSAADDALTAIARQAEGGMRDALSLLDQVMAFAAGGKITLDDTLYVLGSAPLEEFLKLDQRLIQGDLGGALSLLDQLARQGKDLRQFVRDFLAHMRDLMLLKVDTAGVALDLPAQAIEELRAQAGAVDQAKILAAIRVLAELENDLRFTSSPRLLVEVGLIRLAGLYAGQVEVEPAKVAAFAPPPVAAKRSEQAAAPQGQPEPTAVPTATVAAAPEPAAVASAAPSPTGEGVDQVVQVWNQVLDLVKRNRPSTCTLLNQAKIGRLRGNTLILVAPNNAFAELLKRPADKSIVEKALAKVGLSGIDVQAVGPDDAAAKPGPEASPLQAQEPKSTGQRSLLEKVQAVFPKDLVVEIKEDDD